MSSTTKGEKIITAIAMNMGLANWREDRYLLMGLVSFSSVMISGFYVFGESKDIISGTFGCGDPLGIPLLSLSLGAIFFTVSLFGLLHCMTQNKILGAINVLGLMFLTLVGMYMLILWKGTVNDDDFSRVWEEDEIEPSLNRYPGWLQAYVDGQDKPGNANNCIGSCMARRNICGKLQKLDLGNDTFLYPEINCCRPPGYCGFEQRRVEGEGDTGYVTKWVAPEEGLATEDGDCKLWDNSPTKLCYHCDTCKAAFAYAQEDKWFNTAMNNLCFGFIILMLTVIPDDPLRQGRTR